MEKSIYEKCREFYETYIKIEEFNEKIDYITEHHRIYYRMYLEVLKVVGKKYFLRSRQMQGSISVHREYVNQRTLYPFIFTLHYMIYQLNYEILYVNPVIYEKNKDQGDIVKHIQIRAGILFRTDKGIKCCVNINTFSEIRSGIVDDEDMEDYIKKKVNKLRKYGGDIADVRYYYIVPFIYCGTECLTDPKYDPYLICGYENIYQRLDGEKEDKKWYVLSNGIITQGKMCKNEMKHEIMKENLYLDRHTYGYFKDKYDILENKREKGTLRIIEDEDDRIEDSLEKNMRCVMFALIYGHIFLMVDGHEGMVPNDILHTFLDMKYI